MLLAACTSSSEAKRAEPEPAADRGPAYEPSEALPAPAPEPAQPAPNAPAAPAAPAAPTTPGAAEPSPERALYDIIVRLVDEPTALAELAPKAKIEIYGVKDVDKHAIKDAKAELGWLFEKEHVQFAPPGTRLIDIRGSSLKCNAKELTCRASYGGGQTDFTFAHGKDKVVLTKVISQLN
jgi:hypothetical protein